MESVLEVDSVMHSFNGRIILSDVYLKCKTGDVVAVVGRNGSGKSTLFNIITGVRKADRAFIRINNKVISRKTYKTGLIAFLPQMSFLPPELTPLQIVNLCVKDKTSFFKDRLLSCLQNQQINKLSGGEIKYLEVKLLLNIDVPFVILDEPFKGLSPIIIEQIKQQITYNTKDKGIIITDHNFRAISSIATHFLFLNDGYLKGIKNKNELEKYGYL